MGHFTSLCVCRCGWGGGVGGGWVGVGVGVFICMYIYSRETISIFRYLACFPSRYLEGNTIR